MTRPLASFLCALAIILTGLNLRPALAALGPLLDAIQTATGLSFKAAGLATSLPIMAMGILALGGAGVYRFGMRRGIAIGLSLIVAACVIRLFPDRQGQLLLITALVAGLGIGLVQTLMPGFIKMHFPSHVERLMGLYITAIMGGAALAALVSPAVLPYTGWQYALGMWAIPAGLGLLLWLASTRGAHDPAVSPQATPGVIRQPRAWTLATVFGVETGCYTLLLAWLAPFYLQQGWTAQEAGALLAGLTLCEVVAGLAISFYASRWPDRRLLMTVCATMGMAGFLCLFIAPVALAWLAIALLGFGIGALFPLTLILTMDHSSNSRRAGVLTAFVQGVGYMIAAAMPSLAGAMRDRLGSFDMAWLAIAVILALSLLLILRFSLASTKQFDRSFVA